MSEKPAAHFAWGDIVVVRAEAPEKFRPGEAGLVIGVFDAPVISRLRYRRFEDVIVYSVEYDDGDAFDVEQKWLTAAR